MKNLKTIALLVLAVVVVGAAIVLGSVTDFKVEDAFAAARVVSTGGNNGEIYFTKAPAPKPVPSKTLATISSIASSVSSVGTALTKPAPTTTTPATPRTDPTTINPNTTRVTATKPPLRTGGDKTPAIQPRTPTTPTTPNPGVQPVKSPGNPPVSKTPYKVVCPDDYTLDNGRCFAKCAQTGFLGLCTKPKCPSNQVMNTNTNLCADPAPTYCKSPLVLKDGKCVTNPDIPTCTHEGMTAVSGVPCCKGTVVYGRCMSTAIGDPPSTQKPPVQIPNCPLQVRWCDPAAGTIFDFGRSGHYKCLDMPIPSCGIVRSLVSI